MCGNIKYSLELSIVRSLNYSDDTKTRTFGKNDYNKQIAKYRIQ